jgi:hypothetical protein
VRRTNYRALIFVTWYVRLYTGFELVIGTIEHLENITTNNYDSPTDLRTPIAVTTAHRNSSHSSIAVAWQRLSTADVAFFWVPNCPRPQPILTAATLNGPNRLNHK